MPRSTIKPPRPGIISIPYPVFDTMAELVSYVGAEFAEKLKDYPEKYGNKYRTINTKATRPVAEYEIRYILDLDTKHEERKGRL